MLVIQVEDIVSFIFRNAGDQDIKRYLCPFFLCWCYETRLLAFMVEYK
jgi:hypothetical protein